MRTDSTECVTYVVTVCGNWGHRQANNIVFLHNF